MPPPTSYLSLTDLPVYDARRSGVVADGTTDCAAAITSALQATVYGGYGICQLPPGTIKISKAINWLNANDLWLRGAGGQGKTVIEGATSTTGGIVYNAGVRIFRCYITDMTIHGGGAGSGNGIEVSDWDRGGFERLRVYGWNNCVKLISTGPLGALHNIFYNCVITNGVVNGVWLTGAQGPHETMFIGGEQSICGVGLQIDTPTDACRVFGTTYESNVTRGIVSDGRRCYFNCRFEGNVSKDIEFTANSFYNILETSFLDVTKVIDNSTTGGNFIRGWGVAASVTQPFPNLYIPDMPIMQTSSSIIPGASGTAFLMKFFNRDYRKLTKVTVVPSVQNGNLDCALWSSGGTLLVSNGGTPVGPVNAKQDVTLATYPNTAVFNGIMAPNTFYWIGLMFDGATAGFQGSLTNSSFLNLTANDFTSRTKAGLTFPFGTQDAVTGASSSTSVLVCALA